MKTSTAIWLSGLSGAGKTTLGMALKKAIEEQNFRIKLFDGDEMRNGLCKDLKFSVKDREENIRRVSEVNNLFLCEGFVTINAFITPTNKMRQIARSVIRCENFFEVYLSTPISTCRCRDPKGLYKTSDSGKLNYFSGVDAVFEPSLSADITLDTSDRPVEACVKLITDKLLLNYR